MSRNSDWFAERRAERLEDVAFLADTGECASGAARRLGMTLAALEKWCRRNDPDSYRRLLAREPRVQHVDMTEINRRNAEARWAS